VAHVQEKPVPPSARTELEIPEALDQVIMACLEKDPDDRPASAADLDAMLAAALAERWTAEDAREWWTLHLSEVAAYDDDGASESHQGILHVDR